MITDNDKGHYDTVVSHFARFLRFQVQNTNFEYLMLHQITEHQPNRSIFDNYNISIHYSINCPAVCPSWPHKAITLCMQIKSIKILRYSLFRGLYFNFLLKKCQHPPLA